MSVWVRIVVYTCVNAASTVQFRCSFNNQKHSEIHSSLYIFHETEYPNSLSDRNGPINKWWFLHCGGTRDRWTSFIPNSTPAVCTGDFRMDRRCLGWFWAAFSLSQLSPPLFCRYPPFFQPLPVSTPTIVLWFSPHSFDPSLLDNPLPRGPDFFFIKVVDKGEVLDVVCGGSGGGSSLFTKKGHMWF